MSARGYLMLSANMNDIIFPTLIDYIVVGFMLERKHVARTGLSVARTEPF